MSYDTVTVGCVTFTTPTKAKAWVAKHSLERVLYMFTNMILFLSLVDNTTITKTEDSAKHVQSEQAQDNSHKLIRYKGSFCLVLPWLFTGGSKSMVVH